MKTDLEIFTDWRESSLAKHIVTENSQAGAMIEFAKYYHKEQLKSNKITIASFRKIYDQFYREEISMSKMIEMLNDSTKPKI